MFEIFVYSYLTSIFVFASGIFFSKKIINIDFNKEVNLFQIGLNGFIFLSFLALFINFFSELNKLVNTIIISIFFIYLFLNNKILVKKVLIYSIFSSLICLAIIAFDNTYRPDAGLYHLPFTKILNDEKIIVGLSNIHFRYGHTSIIQYIAALNNNWVFGDKGILIPLSIIFSFIILYLFQEIRNEKNQIILIFNYIIFSFICLKLNRYSDFGNDAPAHIFYFFLISLALKNFKNFNKDNMGEMLSISAFVIFNKITLFLSALIPILILFQKKKIISFNFKILIFLFIFSFSFFFKNFISSGCIAFPIEKTCINQVFWYDKESERGSNAKNTMLENEAWTKGWSDQRENRKNFEEYLSNYNWVKLWSQNHGKRTLNKLAPFLSFLILFIFIIGYLSKNKKFENSTEENNKLFKFLKSLLILNIIGSLMWFLKFPVFRYGSSYLISNIAILILTIFWSKIISIDLYKLKRIVIYLVVILFFILLSKNLIRILKNYDNVYFNSPWPKIYADDNYNNKKLLKPVYKNNEIIFYQPNKGLCYYNSAPCTHMLDSQFSINELNFKFIFSYKVFYF